MNVEQLDIRGHMAQFAPFDDLPDALLDRIAGEVEIRYFQAGSELLVKDQPSKRCGTSAAGRWRCTSAAAGCSIA